jgi:paraquat-inducible protein B
MSRRASPAVIGTFVIVGILLAMTAVVILSGGRWFRPTARLIVYFDENVNGLNIGAPVKFRGIEVGRVRDIRINMPGAIHDPANIRIPVVIEIDPDRLSRKGVTEIDFGDPAQVRAMVDQGLRAELGLESFVTGLRYVALDVKPNTPAFLVANPKVHYPEIPSIRGPIEDIPEKLKEVLANVAKVDFEELAQSVRQPAADAHRLLSSPDLTRAVAGLDELVDRMNRTAAQLETASRSLTPAAAELGRAATSARRLVDPEGRVPAELAATLRELKDAARSARHLADQLSRDPGSLLRGGRQ